MSSDDLIGDHQPVPGNAADGRGATTDQAIPRLAANAAEDPISTDAHALLRRPEQRKACRVTMDEVPPANWSEFSRREEAGDRRLRQRALRLPDVMPRGVEHARAAAVATEQQRAGRGAAFLLGIEQRGQVFAGGG